jgi:RHS repeat-associated protein
VALKSGYNLISCPKPKETKVEQALLPLKLGVDYDKVYHYNKATSLFEKYDDVVQEFTQLLPGESYYIFCPKEDFTWNLINTKPTTTFVYDGDGGRVKKIVGSNSTTYIGSLFEVESDGTIRKHIFSGANRICSVAQGQSAAGGLSLPSLAFYHSDHLGSSNLITDKDGNQVGLTEFTPYGSISKQTGSYDPKYKFTGKELDSSTELYFYGARYYDPELGRFITADPTIQKPYDPQDLNRYTYCRNNPINLIDPTGLGWKKFWKKFMPILFSVVFAALTVFTWGVLAPGITGMGLLFSKVGAVIVSSAAATTATLNTGEGRQFQERLGNEVFDDVFGMRPSTARIFGTIAAYMIVNMAFQFGFAQVYGANKVVTDVKQNDPHADKMTNATLVEESKGVNIGTRIEIDPKTGELMQIKGVTYKTFYSGEESIGLGAEALKIGGQPQHLSAIWKGGTLQSDMPGFFEHPFKALSQGYLTFGTSHQAVNIGALSAGIRTTVNSLLKGGWSTVATTFVYGPYGGGAAGAATYEQTKNRH